MIDEEREKWQKVVHADELKDCPLCDEKWCEKHHMHYADCDCIGPTQDGVQYKVLRGIVYGRKISNEKGD